MKKNIIKHDREDKKNISVILSWALYDLANQFFALNVVSLYFVRWVTIEKNCPEIFYSLTFGISMFFVALSAPILGAISDARKQYKPFLIYFTVLAVIFTILLGASENILLGLLFFAIANFGCQTAIVFYNSLIIYVSPGKKIGLVSGLGRMFGYAGAILALHLTKPIILEKGYHAVFLPTGILFLIFSLPCMFFIKEPSSAPKINLSSFFRKKILFEIFKKLKTTITDGKQKSLPNFLTAVFFGLCAVNVIILFMSVYADKAFGLTENQIINLIAFSAMFAILGSILSGFISDYMGYRRSLIGIFFLWGITLLAGGILTPDFYLVVGALGGISLGSIWVVLRALVVNLFPKEKIGEIFGLVNFVSYLSAIAGPLYWGLILLYLSKFGQWGYRLACLSLILFVATGIFFLLRIPEETGNSR